MTNDKTSEEKYLVRTCLKVVLGFAEHHENAKNGLRYKLTLKGNTDRYLISHVDGTITESLALPRRDKIEDICWFVLLYNTNITLQNFTLHLQKIL